MKNHFCSFFALIACLFQKFCIFALFSEPLQLAGLLPSGRKNAEAQWVEAAGREPIYRKSVLDALCLTHRNLAVYAVDIHIGVGFGVARSTDRTMPEPRCVGRATRRFPRFLYIVTNNY